jgi:hypothetical protein
MEQFFVLVFFLFLSFLQCKINVSRQSLFWALSWLGWYEGDQQQQRKKIQWPICLADRLSVWRLKDIFKCVYTVTLMPINVISSFVGSKADHSFILFFSVQQWTRNMTMNNADLECLPNSGKWKQNTSKHMPNFSIHS